MGKYLVKEELLNAKIIDKRIKLEQPLIFSGDKNANSIIFEMPVICDGITLSGVPVYVKTTNALGICSKALLTAEVKGDILLIEWRLGIESTGVCGELECQLVFESSDGNMIMNTMPFYVTIEQSVIDCGESINIQTNHITQLQNALQEQIKRVDEIIAKGILTDANLEEKLKQMTEYHGNKNMIFKTLKEAINSINYAPPGILKVGDCVRVEEYGVPHFMVKEIRSSPVAQIEPYVESLVQIVKQNGCFAAGWYNFTLTSTLLTDELPVASESPDGYVLTIENGKWVAKESAFPPIYDNLLEVV